MDLHIDRLAFAMALQYSVKKHCTTPFRSIYVHNVDPVDVSTVLKGVFADDVENAIRRSILSTPFTSRFHLPSVRRASATCMTTKMA